MSKEENKNIITKFILRPKIRVLDKQDIEDISDAVKFTEKLTEQIDFNSLKLK